MEKNQELKYIISKRNVVFIVIIGIVSILSTIIFIGLIVGSIGIFFFIKTLKRYKADPSLYKPNTKKVLKTGLILNLVGIILSVIFLMIGIIGVNYYERGISYMKEKKFEQAVESLRKVKSNDKNYLDALSKLHEADSLMKIESALKRKNDSINRVEDLYLQKVKDSLSTVELESKRRKDSINRIEEQIRDLKGKREELIKKQFSAWDGSHIELTKLIKKAMNDPDSYEHVETNYWDMTDYIVVRTTYSGKNAYGGRVKNFVKAKIDDNGNILEIMEEGAGN